MARKEIPNILKELRSKEIVLLSVDLLEKKREYAKSKLKFRLKTEKNSASLRKSRIEIARLQTVIREKEILGK